MNKSVTFGILIELITATFIYFFGHKIHTQTAFTDFVIDNPKVAIPNALKPLHKTDILKTKSFSVHFNQSFIV